MQKPLWAVYSPMPRTAALVAVNACEEGLGNPDGIRALFAAWAAQIFIDIHTVPPVDLHNPGREAEAIWRRAASLFPVL